MFVDSVVCMIHWLMEHCQVYCRGDDRLKLFGAAVPDLLLDVVLLFRKGHYSQETVALHVEVQSNTEQT
jgi:hypothetical protein